MSESVPIFLALFISMFFLHFLYLYLPISNSLPFWQFFCLSCTVILELSTLFSSFMWLFIFLIFFISLSFTIRYFSLPPSFPFSIYHSLLLLYLSVSPSLSLSLSNYCSEDDMNVENRELQEGEVEEDESWPPLEGKYDPLGLPHYNSKKIL